MAVGDAITEDRFAFGANWRKYLALVDDTRVEAARRSLTDYLDADDLTGVRFLDIGSGSGLFSLAARSLGAEVVSFDYDPESVSCTRAMRERYRPDDSSWSIEQGSVLDREFLDRLGRFNVVYAWGVLHHTGDLESALENAGGLVGDGGRLFISIYNDQGRASHTWKRVKRTYNESGPVGKKAVLSAARSYFALRRAVSSAERSLRRLPREPEVRQRGMDRERDLVDWVGGWPFEVATPERIFEFYRDRGFRMDRMKTCRGELGCNEFVFTRS